MSKGLCWSLGLALLLAAGGCGKKKPGGDKPSGDDGPVVTDTGCKSAADCSFGQRCKDGACSSEVPPPATDTGCTSNDDCPAGQACAPSSGLCVSVAQEPDPLPDQVPDCEEGAVRTCGSKIGQCQYGTQKCVGGTWEADCNGAVGPKAELCNGLDDDCDGVVPPEELDTDGDGMPACAGDCDPNDPTVYDGAPELCDNKNNDCDNDTDEGTDPLCDDGVYCNGAETCSGGSCTSGAPIDCSGLDGVCVVGQCDEGNRTCKTTNRSDGTSCDDGLFCTVGTTCSNGSCGGGSAYDCTAEDDQCNVGTCDEAGRACVKSPLDDNTLCDDGLFCTVGDRCVTGACVPTGDRSCDAVGSCQAGTCDEDADACTGGPAINEGLGCDDGQFCTVGETCQSGACKGGTARDCSAAGNQCNDGVCNAATAKCERQPKAGNPGCEDGLFCTTGDTCQGGVCQGGSLYDCTSAGDQCNDGVCDETSDSCKQQPKNDGIVCDDGLLCKINDRCVAGACVGSDKSCTSENDVCNLGVCDPADGVCKKSPKTNGTLCEDGAFCTAGDTCQGGSCQSGGPRDCSLFTDQCNDGVCNESTNRCEPVDNGLCVCSRDIDNDFDGANECQDCDDTNGSIYPGATERCNGLDDDCDGEIDEDFDVDHDGYSVCAQDPLLIDCNDNDPLINPGAPENCGPDGTGNGKDDNCNGYVDEGCAPCDALDQDGDGISECQGDCAPADGTIYPGNTEACDGKDNDCNVFTVENCDVSDPCNWPSGADVCAADLMCACIVNNRGACSDTYVCTSFCNTSQTTLLTGQGLIGDGCQPGQACYYDLLYTANVHGCAVVDQALGNKYGGSACSSGTECRSGKCVRVRGNVSYCLDYCGSDAYCPASGTVCELWRASDNMDGICWPQGTNTKAVGEACLLDSECNHDFCANVGGSRYCTEPCCTDSDCGSGYSCGLTGDQISTTYVTVPPDAGSCTSDAQCPSGMMCFTTDNKCAWRLSETSPMCVKDEVGQGTRRAGAACSSNSQCISNFCERSLGVCVETCCNDTTCPEGLSCDLQLVQTTPDRVTSARVCVNQSIDGVLLRK